MMAVRSHGLLSKIAGSEPPLPGLIVKYSSDDTGSTVEVEVSKSPVYRMTLRSQEPRNPWVLNLPLIRQRKQPHHKILMYLPIQPAANTPNPPARKPKRPKKDKGKPRKKKAPTFHLPIQRTFRRDNVDEECRRLKITYRRWPGMTEPKDQLHKSHCQFSGQWRWLLSCDSEDSRWLRYLPNAKVSGKSLGQETPLLHKTPRKITCLWWRSNAAMQM